MAVDGYLNFNTKINTKGFQKGLNTIGTNLDGLKKGLYTIAAAAGVAFSVKAIADFGKQAVTLASDMQEVQNVVDTAFGDMAYKMEEFAETAIQQYGISRLAAKQTGSTFAAMASGMGVAQDSATDMAVALTGLSADMASFYNVEQEVASTALKSVFTGETETLKQFGIVMTQTNLEAYALSQGITKSYQSMTEAEKVALRYGYVMQSTALAQGDFSKTSDGWANQMRILSEQWKEFSTTIGNAVMNVALPCVRALNDAMGTLIAQANAAYNSMANLFGWEAVQTSAAGITTEISGSVSEQEALTDAVNETAKAQERALAGFDKINKLGSSDSASADSGGTISAASGTGVSGNAVAAGADAEETASRIIAAFGNVFAPFRQAWEDCGKPVMDSIRSAFDGIGSVLSGIGQSFATVWSNGTGYRIVSTILQIFTNISNTIGTISEQFATAWNSGTGTSIVQGMAEIFQNVLDTINDCAAATADWAQGLDFEPILTEVDGVVQALDPLSENVGEGLEWFYTNVLLPLAEWTIEDAIPAFLDALSAAVDTAVSAIDDLKPLGKWMLDKFLEPITEWTGGVIVSVIEDMADALQKVSDWISKHKTAVQDFAIVVGTLGAAFKIASIITAATAALTAAGGVMGVLTGITAALGAAVSFLTSPITLVCLAIGAVIAAGVLLIRHWDEVREFAGSVWESIVGVFSDAWNGICEVFSGVFEFFSDRWEEIVEVFAPAVDWFGKLFSSIIRTITDTCKVIIALLNGIWITIKIIFSPVVQWFSDRLSDIKSVFSNVGSWFGEKFNAAYTSVTGAFEKTGEFFGGIWDSIVNTFGSVADWFEEKFSAAWTAVKNVFSTGGEIFGDILDGLDSIFTDVVNSIIDGLNTVIAAPFEAINGALDTVRNFSIMGQQPFSGIPTISIPEIPKLATGTVVPANYGEFLAVLGDNKRETEVVSPLSTMEQAMENVLRRRGDGGDIHLNVTLDGKTVYRTVIRKNNESIRMTGKNPLAPKEVTT